MCLSLRVDSVPELSHQKKELYNRQALDKALLVKQPVEGGCLVMPIFILDGLLADRHDARRASEEPALADWYPRIRGTEFYCRIKEGMDGCLCKHPSIRSLMSGHPLFR